MADAAHTKFLEEEVERLTDQVAEQEHDIKQVINFVNGLMTELDISVDTFKGAASTGQVVTSLLTSLGPKLLTGAIDLDKINVAPLTAIVDKYKHLTNEQ